MQPHSPEIFASSADRAACRALIRAGSRSFHAASRLLPIEIREGAIALYAFCRLADDAIDAPGRAAGGMPALHERLERAYGGRPLAIAADRAFADTVRQFAIPRELPQALLEGLAWDAAGRRFEDLAELEAYGVRVAGSVGAMLACLMGVRCAQGIARACDLGVAMQLTNIARDVGEDARAGRIYLPLAWMREAGLEPDRWLAHPRFSPALGRVIARLLRHADGLYERARPGVALLPRDCRAGIHAARLIYAEIGHELARSGLDSVARRAVVSPLRKLQLLLSAVLESARAPVDCVLPALAAAQFLVSAVSSLPESNSPRHRGRGGGCPESGVAWVLALFERLERDKREFAPRRPQLPDSRS